MTNQESPVDEKAKVLGRLRLQLDKDTSDAPLYVRIARLLAEEISSGRVSEGARLPSQRALASALEVNITTISKAFRYLKERGVVRANTGKGTVVRGRALAFSPLTFEEPIPPRIDLSVYSLHDHDLDATLAEALAEVARRLPHDMQSYQPPLGTRTSRRIGQVWMNDIGVPAGVSQIAATAGGQHGLFLTLAAVLAPGDVLLAPPLVYPGLKAAANVLGVGVLPVESDEHGIVPNSIERLVSSQRVKGIYVVPSVDNPTTAFLPLSRRHEIAEIAARNSVLIIEDDAFRPVHPEPEMSIYEIDPDRTFHISTLSKAITPACRSGFLAAPAAYIGKIAQVMRATMWMADQFGQALSDHLITSGAHRRIIQHQRKFYRARQQEAEKILGPLISPGTPEANICWVNLPKEHLAQGVADVLRSRGIGVGPSNFFRLGADTGMNGLRIFKSSARTDDEWHFALAMIAEALSEVPPELQTTL